MIITTKKIQALNPCRDRFANWSNYYLNFRGGVEAFIQLENITASDKIWVLCRILPRELIEVFAIDCAVNAAAYAAAYVAAAYAADVAAAAAYAAAAPYTYAVYAYAAADVAAAATYAARSETRERQLDALIYLYRGWK